MPKPVKAVILLFPITQIIDKKTQEEVAYITVNGQHPIDPDIIWIKQTVGNRFFKKRIVSD